ncbi:MAG: hypothetical protein E6R13_05125 [Spirochaetes bacterium]|nr:MAG: hypothetical protein E6R13_05125 [Spirochaetota bacterium]
MSDVKYAYYHSSKGYKIVGGNSNQLLRADGGVEDKADYSVKSANETFGGVKTFTLSPIIPNATSPNHAVNKEQLDAKIPYTGATANVDLGATNQIKAKEFDAIGSYVEKPNTNRNYEVLKLNGTALVVYQSNVWNGSAWGGSNSNGVGSYALQYNTGSYSNGCGEFSLQYNTGGYSNGFGYNTLQYNTGANSNGFGYVSLMYNTGDNSNGFGHYALRYNTGNNSNGFGYMSLMYNTGDGSNGIGYNALIYNTGNNSNGFGLSALRGNTGNNSNGFGYAPLMYNIGNESNGFGSYTLSHNTGNNSNGFGYESLQYNTGANSNGFGLWALRYNTGANNSVLGSNSFSNFYIDTVNAKLFDATAIDMTAKTITIPNHGFGTNGTYTNLKFTQGSSAITGLANGTIVQVKIIDANTIAYEEVIQAGQVRRSVNITNAGTGRT